MRLSPLLSAKPWRQPLRQSRDRRPRRVCGGACPRRARRGVREPWTFAVLVIVCRGHCGLGMGQARARHGRRSDRAGRSAYGRRDRAPGHAWSIDAALISIPVALVAVWALVSGRATQLGRSSALLTRRSGLRTVWLRGRPDARPCRDALSARHVWTTDTASYAAGRLIGGPKLAPAISPKKTWSRAHCRHNCTRNRRLCYLLVAEGHFWLSARPCQHRNCRFLPAWRFERERGEAKVRSQGYESADSRPWRPARPDRWPLVCEPRGCSDCFARPIEPGPRPVDVVTS